jgi:hypothetical protein
MLAAPRNFATIDTPGQILAMDLDNDGDVDVGVMLFGPTDGNNNDNIVDHWVLLKNPGTGNLGAPVLQPAGAAVVGLVFAQIDGKDGLDALTTAGDNDRLSCSLQPIRPVPVARGDSGQRSRCQGLRHGSGGYRRR